MIQAKHKYGMKLRGFSLGTQPKEGFLERRDPEDWEKGRYYDILYYDRLLTQEECDNYDLKYLGAVASLSEVEEK
jgi:hypothetical protein